MFFLTLVVFLGLLPCLCICCCGLSGYCLCRNRQRYIAKDVEGYRRGVDDVPDAAPTWSKRALAIAAVSGFIGLMSAILVAGLFFEPLSRALMPFLYLLHKIFY